MPLGPRQAAHGRTTEVTLRLLRRTDYRLGASLV